MLKTLLHWGYPPKRSRKACLGYSLRVWNLKPFKEQLTSFLRGVDTRVRGPTSDVHFCVALQRSIFLCFLFFVSLYLSLLSVFLFFLFLWTLSFMILCFRCFFRQSLPLTLGMQIPLGWLAREHQGSSCLCLPSIRLTNVPTFLALFLF